MVLAYVIKKMLSGLYVTGIAELGCPSRYSVYRVHNQLFRSLLIPH